MKELKVCCQLDSKAFSKQNLCACLISFWYQWRHQTCFSFSLENVFHNGLDNLQGLTLARVSFTNMSATLPVLCEFQHPRPWMSCCETLPAAGMEGPGVFLPALLAWVIWPLLLTASAPKVRENLGCGDVLDPDQSGFSSICTLLPEGDS